MKHIVIDARIRQSSSGKPIERLIEYLQKLDRTNQYTVLVSPDDTWQPDVPNFSVKTCRYKKFSINPLEQVGFSVFLRRLKADVVHFGMTPQEPLFYFGKRITMTHDLTMFRHARAERLPEWMHRIRMMLYGLWFWWSLRLAKQVIVPTKFVAKDVSTRYPFVARKITVTYESSEPPIEGESRKLKGKSLESPFLFHVGSPFPHKNIDRLVTAFEVLKQKHPDLKLVLAGRREYYFAEMEEHIATSKFKQDIIAPGFVTDAELKWLYENAEMYVLPSLSEGFGLPGLEAMAHSCPLVSSNATCLPEVYGDAAVYFNPRDINEMTDAIEKVLDDHQLRKELVKKGHAQLKKYSWEKMAKETLTVYDKVLRLG